MTPLVDTLPSPGDAGAFGPGEPAGAGVRVFPGGHDVPGLPTSGTVQILKAAGNPLRWQMLATMAQHGPQGAASLAKRLRCPYEVATKHLRVLRAAGAVDSRRTADRRMTDYFIPPAVLVDLPNGERVLDYAHCRLRPGLRAPAPTTPPPPAPPPPDDENFFFTVMP